MTLGKIWVIESDEYDGAVQFVADSPEAGRLALIESHEKYKADNPTRKGEYGWDARWGALEIQGDMFRLTAYYPSVGGTTGGTSAWVISEYDYAKDDPDVR